MDDRLIPTQNERIEDALRSYPPASMPRSITSDVMARLQTTPAPRFQLTRKDLILAVVLTAVFNSILFGLQFLPGHVVLQIQIQGILAWQAFLVNMRWLLPALFFGLAAVLAALTVPILYRMTMDGRR
ncbi:MAG TPA: hypothetical protein VFY26_03010 [Anaerolineales bacterium]|nr:hypothetical protein [Anaerolineales bacterium]